MDKKAETTKLSGSTNLKRKKKKKERENCHFATYKIKLFFFAYQVHNIRHSVPETTRVVS